MVRKLTGEIETIASWRLLVNLAWADFDCDRPAWADQVDLVYTLLWRLPNQPVRVNVRKWVTGTVLL
ncbi:MAG: hypothetical protein NVS4B8_23280 [Herpetosiphon sp.]